jgi:hypothetical protein
MAPPADLTDLQRRTIQQARTQSLVPMKYDVGMDPNTPLFDRIGEVAGRQLATAALQISRVGRSRVQAPDLASATGPYP